MPLSWHLWEGQLGSQSSTVALHLSPEPWDPQSPCPVHGTPPHSWGLGSGCHLPAIKLLAPQHLQPCISTAELHPPWDGPRCAWLSWSWVEVG